MKKIAFCISGQIRSFDALKLLNEEIIRIKDNFNFEIKVFLSTWKQKGLKKDGGLHPAHVMRIYDEKLCPYLPESWINEKDPTKFWSYCPKNLERINNLANKSSSNLSIEKILELINVDYIDLEDENIDLEFDDWHISKKFQPNTKKMHYKVWKCNAAKKYYERQNGPFDFVIACRPDLSIRFRHNINKLEINDNEVFCQIFKNPPILNRQIGDMIRLSNSKTADLLSSMFSRTIESPNSWYDAHFDYYQFCKGRGMKLNRIQEVIKLQPLPVMTDIGELISFRDLILDYPELEEAYNDSSKISGLPESLKKIAEGFHASKDVSN